MREVFLLMKYNLTTLKIYSKEGRKFKFFLSNRIKIQENSVQILKIHFKHFKISFKIHMVWYGAWLQLRNAKLVKRLK